jgi:hypothetical protein
VAGAAVLTLRQPGGQGKCPFSGRLGRVRDTLAGVDKQLGVSESGPDKVTV